MALTRDKWKSAWRVRRAPAWFPWPLARVICLTYMNSRLFIYRTAVDMVLVRISQILLLNLSDLKSQSLFALQISWGYTAHLSSHSRSQLKWDSHHLNHCPSPGQRERETFFLPQKTFSHLPPAISKWRLLVDFRLLSLLLQQLTLTYSDQWGYPLVQPWPPEEVRVEKRIWYPWMRSPQDYSSELSCLKTKASAEVKGRVRALLKISIPGLTFIQTSKFLTENTFSTARACSRGPTQPFFWQITSSWSQGQRVWLAQQFPSLLLKTELRCNILVF